MDEPVEEEATPTAAGLAEEISRETAALTQLLGAYASKADVERKLLAERVKTKALIGERDHARLVTVIACVVTAAFAIGMSVWAVGVSHDAAHSAQVANTAGAAAQKALELAAANDERQQVVSCNDANKNRSALVSLFDYIDKLSQDVAQRTGRTVDSDTIALVQFGRTTFAPRDCTAEAAERHAEAPTTTVPGG